MAKNDSDQAGAMSFAALKHIGFIDPRQRPERRRAVALAQLIATIALILSIAVAATVVSIGIAHAGATASLSTATPSAATGAPYFQ
jgi:hypothetical protein